MQNEYKNIAKIQYFLDYLTTRKLEWEALSISLEERSNEHSDLKFKIETLDEVIEIYCEIFSEIVHKE